MVSFWRTETGYNTNDETILDFRYSDRPGGLYEQ